MREDRPFPPSARRRGLAIRAGIHAASPIVVGAAACAAVVLALVLTGRALADRLGTALAAACNGAGLGADQLVTAVIATALPILGAAAIVAVIAHLAQTRALWLPRRRVEGAPVLERGAVRRAGFELLAAAIVGVVAFAWLWWVAPRLARLSTVDDLAGSGGQVLASAVAAVAIAWVAIGACDAVLRHVELARALRMTAREKREDDRLGSADPRWRRLRTRLSREPTIRAAAAGPEPRQRLPRQRRAAPGSRERLGLEGRHRA
ncbi:MAG: EscU/YscU/HrcU family type III secretion system export apparatus switch protein, partial [Kofleriaceae bacterium]